jgi:RimJ/RimL family protein N-acetyltransferase/8-oxo-dGTP pyrophosphatase MutT (NUDIX family)
VTEQPTLTDGSLTLRPWRDGDVEQVLAGQDDEIAHWAGRPAPSRDELAATVADLRTGWAEGTAAGFVVEHAGDVVGSVEVRRTDTHSGDLTWALYAGHRGRGHATRAVRALADWALTDTEEGGLGLSRVQARVDPANERSTRVATRSGLLREGLQRVVPGTGERAETEEYVVLSRLRTDPPLSEPGAFRALLNSFLPRKRAIAQMLVRDTAGRVLLCRLTYKTDWDLPGGVVEVGESPQVAVAREVTEELALDLPAGRLLLTDWLPPWGGWDDALCLVFDGGAHDASLLDAVVEQPREIASAQFCTPAEVREHCADFTARRVEAALAAVADGSSRYTESGRESGRESDRA